MFWTEVIFELALTGNDGGHRQDRCTGALLSFPIIFKWRLLHGQGNKKTHSKSPGLYTVDAGDPRFRWKWRGFSVNTQKAKDLMLYAGTEEKLDNLTSGGAGIGRNGRGHAEASFDEFVSSW
jgi:hypothetical protein